MNKKLKKHTEIISYMKLLGFTARETFEFIQQFGVNKGYEIVESTIEEFGGK